jgi:predicted DNA-binding transcriptional regulator AlpA
MQRLDDVLATLPCPLPLGVINSLRRALGTCDEESLLLILEQLAGLQARAEVQVRSASGPAPAVPAGSQPDVNVPVEEAARRLGISRSYIYKNARSLPFTTRIGRRLVCSARGLERWRGARMRA